VTDDPALREAMGHAERIGKSPDFARFREKLRSRFPQQVQVAEEALERDYVRVVDHHLRSLTPRLRAYLDSNVRRVLDFGCGSGGSAIALAMAYPGVFCHGTDVDAEEIEIAKERAQLYGVAERCDFRYVAPDSPLPFDDGFFDLCQCSSVLEYVVDPAARQFCVREMVRLLAPDGLLFVSVPAGYTHSRSIRGGVVVQNGAGITFPDYSRLIRLVALSGKFRGSRDRRR